MALADLVTLSFNGAVELYLEIQPFIESTDNEIVCRMTRFLGLVLVTTSGCLYLAIVVHRYVLICRPHSQGIPQKWKFITLISTIIFIFGISFPKYIFSGSTLVTMETEKLSNQTVVAYICGTDEDFENKAISKIYFYVLTINSFIWTSAIAVLYAFIGSQVRQQRQKEISTYDRGDERKHPLKADSPRLEGSHPLRQIKRLTKQLTVGSITNFIINNRLTWMFALMTVLNVVTYIPKLVLDILYNEDRYFFLQQPKDMYVALVFLDNFYLFNHVVNPFIYGLFDTEFKNGFKKRFCSCCNFRKKIQING
jgi:hypothetical protein